MGGYPEKGWEIQREYTVSSFCSDTVFKPTANICTFDDNYKIIFFYYFCAKVKAIIKVFMSYVIIIT